MPCARMEPLSIATAMESAVVSTVIARRTTGEYELASDDTTYLRTGCAAAHPITDSAHTNKLPRRRLISLPHLTTSKLAKVLARLVAQSIH